MVSGPVGTSGVEVDAETTAVVVAPTVTPAPMAAVADLATTFCFLSFSNFAFAAALDAAGTVVFGLTAAGFAAPTPFGVAVLAVLALAAFDAGAGAGVRDLDADAAVGFERRSITSFTAAALATLRVVGTGG